jgi:hypothetical protein
MIYLLSRAMAYILWIGGTLAFAGMTVFYIWVCLMGPGVVRRGGLWMVLVGGLFTHAVFYFGRAGVRRWYVPDLRPRPLPGHDNPKRH